MRLGEPQLPLRTLALLMPDKQILLDVGDGPEGITIYTSDDEGVVDWAGSFPAVYITISINGAFAKFGPFSLKGIHDQIKSALKDPPPLD